ncbi:MauE/DoxX family redox-associated membrane protein [Streptosporangium sp. NPDC003464]
MLAEIFPLAVRAALIAVFGMALMGKLRGRVAFRKFARSLAALQWVGRSRAKFAAYMIVAAEMLISTLLVFDATAFYGFCAAVLLLSVFSLFITLSVRRGSRASCACFGASETRLGPQHVVRNLLLAAVATGGAVCAFDGLVYTVPALLVGTAIGVVVGFVVTIADDVAALFTTTAHST